MALILMSLFVRHAACLLHVLPAINCLISTYVEACSFLHSSMISKNVQQFFDPTVSPSRLLSVLGPSSGYVPLGWSKLTTQGCAVKVIKSSIPWTWCLFAFSPAQG